MGDEAASVPRLEEPVVEGEFPQKARLFGTRALVAGVELNIGHLCGGSVEAGRGG